MRFGLVYKEIDVKITLDVELKPFQVPNFVIVKTLPRPRQEGIQEAPKYRLSDLDAITLEKLCDEFRTEVFKKAGKNRPPQAA